MFKLKNICLSLLVCLGSFQAKSEALTLTFYSQPNDRSLDAAHLAGLNGTMDDYNHFLHLLAAENPTLYFETDRGNLYEVDAKPYSYGTIEIPDAETVVCVSIQYDRIGTYGTSPMRATPVREYHVVADARREYVAPRTDFSQPIVQISLHDYLVLNPFMLVQLGYERCQDIESHSIEHLAGFNTLAQLKGVARPSRKDQIATRFTRN